MITIIILPTKLLLPFSQDLVAGTRLHISSMRSTIPFVKQLTLEKRYASYFAIQAKHSTESDMQVSYISYDALVFQADYFLLVPKLLSR